MRAFGVTYDTGFLSSGTTTHEPFAPDTVRREMQIIHDELNCDAIRFTGMSGDLPNLPEHIATGAFDVFLLPYSALDRSHEELITAAATAGAGTIARGSVARPLVAPSEAMPEPMRRPLADRHARLAAAGLDDLAEGASTMELLLRFILGHRDLHSVIVGSTDAAHVQSNVAAAQKGPLPADVYDALRDRLSQT
ncbi:aldo/keto reductase [Nonomuraea sp. NPDC026600]|uniref:aldo/keto reductase n=1 Tax=Nonomuraea sp. NPDC026600 TaxID=3155363 RepID=UPI0034073B05